MDTSVATPERLGVETPVESRSQPLMRQANNEVRRVLRAGESDRLPFFCECPAEACRQPLWITLSEYDVLAAGEMFGVAPGHAAAPLLA